MKFLRFLNKLSNVLFIPMLIGLVYILLFKDELNAVEYGVRYLLLVVAIIVIVGALVKKKVKNEKTN